MSKTKEKKTFVMYDSYMQATQEMTDAEFREAIWKLRDYAVDGKQEKSQSPLVNMFMTMAQPTIDAARNRYEAAKKNGEKGKEYGWKGGRSKKTPEITPEKPQSKPQNKPQSKPLNVNVDVDVNEKDNRDVYGNEDSNATGYADVYADRDDYADVDAYGTGNEDEYEDWNEEEDDYAEEDVDDPEEEDDDWDEETYPTSDTTSSNYYKESSISTTTYPVSQQCKDTMREKIKPTFSYEKPNPILPTTKQELQREYEKYLSVIRHYDSNHLDYDDTSMAALRGATNALMKLKNLSFEQAKQIISATRNQYRQET